MNSIDSKIPRRTNCGDHVHDCPQLAEMLDSLREENARLRHEVERRKAEVVAAEAKLAKVVEIAHDGQSRDALHAFDALLRIQKIAAAKGE